MLEIGKMAITGIVVLTAGLWAGLPFGPFGLCGETSRDPVLTFGYKVWFGVCRRKSVTTRIRQGIEK